MSWQGPVGFNGPQGFSGCTGPKGLQGTPYGPPGITFYKGGAIPVPTNVDDGIARVFLNPFVSGSYYLFDANIAYTIDLFAYTPSPSTDSGVFWSFKNTSGSTLTISISVNPANTGLPSTSSPGQGVYYNGNPISQSVSVAPGAGFTMVYSSDPVTSIQYFIVI
jgi:hypothetical protein